MPAPRDAPPLSKADLHVGFVAAGMATTLLGPVLPALSQRWGVSDALIGLAFTVQFLGTVSMSALSSALVIRFGGGQVMLAGFVLLAAGIGGLAWQGGCPDWRRYSATGSAWVSCCRRPTSSSRPRARDARPRP